MRHKGSQHYRTVPLDTPSQYPRRSGPSSRLCKVGDAFPAFIFGAFGHKCDTDGLKMIPYLLQDSLPDAAHCPFLLFLPPVIVAPLLRGDGSFPHPTGDGRLHRLSLLSHLSHTGCGDSTSISRFSEGFALLVTWRHHHVFPRGRALNGSWGASPCVDRRSYAKVRGLLRLPRAGDNSPFKCVNRSGAVTR